MAKGEKKQRGCLWRMGKWGGIALLGLIGFSIIMAGLQSAGESLGIVVTRTPTPTPTVTSTPTSTPVLSATPTVTSTPVPTDTPVPSATPTAGLIGRSGVIVRSAPSGTADMIDNTIEKDDPLVVVGVLPDGEWYLLDSGGWVHERHVAGRLPDDVAVVTPLPTNTPTVTNTPLPSDTPTITPTGTDTPIPTDTPLPTNTSAAANTPLPTDTPVAQRSESIDLMLPVTSRDSNLRGGPGTGYGIVGSASAGEALDVTGQNGAGDWLQLATGVWIARSLVDNVPDDLPVVESLPAPVQAEPTSVPADQPEAPQENPQAFTCVGGCAEPPDPSCAIKGNVNNKGDRIYHMPGWRDYNRTDIKPEQGDRWFCTAAEAEAAGFRRPERY